VGEALAIDLHRLILEYKPDGQELRVLYSRQDGTNPRTVIRRRKVLDLARRSLQKALKTLDIGDTVVLGSSAFMTREDALLSSASNNEQEARGV
jgi:hypothetical protein